MNSAIFRKEKDPSRKATLREILPSFTQTLEKTAREDFDSVQDFCRDAMIHPTRFYAFLRSDGEGAVPRMDSVVSIFKATHKRSPACFEALLLALLDDIAVGI